MFFIRPDWTHLQHEQDCQRRQAAKEARELGRTIDSNVRGGADRH